MNDYYALTYSNLRLAELRADARREPVVTTRTTLVHRGRGVDPTGDALRCAGMSAHGAVACSA